MFAAASAAYRMNDNRYVKYSDLYSNKEYRTNKSLLLQCLADPTLIQPEDYENSKSVLRFCQGLTLKILQYGKLSDFDTQLLDLVSGDTLSVNRSGILSFAPQAHKIELKRETAMDRARECEREYLPKTKDRVKLDIEVTSCKYSQKWNTYYLTAITSCNHAVSFPYKHSLEVNNHYSISAKVREQGDNFTTQLNFVKIDNNPNS